MFLFTDVKTLPPPPPARPSPPLERATLLENHLKFFPVESISSSEPNEQGVVLNMQPGEMAFLQYGLSQPLWQVSRVIG